MSVNECDVTVYLSGTIDMYILIQAFKFIAVIKTYACDTRISMKKAASCKLARF